MNKLITKSIRIVLGDERYRKLRNWYLFKTYEGPFPQYNSHANFQPDWDNYLDSNKIQLGEGEQVSVNYNPPPVVYIVSPTQRSGTNFLSKLLEKHPDLAIPAGNNLATEQCLYSYSESLKSYLGKTVTAWNHWNKTNPSLANEQTKWVMRYFGEGLLRYLSNFIEQGKTLLLKTPDSNNLPDIFHMIPHARVVILLRDGRDTVQSYANSWGGGFGTFGKMCKRWADRAQTILRFKEKAARSGYDKQIYEVYYEQLNSNTSEELKKIFNFLELDNEKYPWEGVDEVPVLGSSTYRGEKEKNVHWKPISKTENFNPNKKWLSWSRAKKNIFIRNAGKSLIELGFEKDNKW